MKLEDLLPPIGDRVFFTGQTGSGKSTLAEFLLRQRQYVVIFDGKSEIRWKGYEYHSTLKKLTESKQQDRLVYQPNWQELRNEDYINRFFEWVYLRHNTTLYIDEVYTITIGQSLPEFYHACLTRGRQLGISVWSGCQRPIQIPSFILSESENAFLFRLSMSGDREKVESLYSIEADRLNEIDKRQFYCVKQNGSEIRGPYKLKIRR